MSCNNTHNATFSPESASGHTPCALQNGQTVEKSGQAHVRVNLSARLADVAGLMTSGTYGRIGIGSSNNAALMLFLASKLQVLTGSVGSILYNLTWKARVTPQQRLIYALRASVRRTSGSACISWPTPATRDYKGESGAGRQERKGYPAVLTSWPTPQAIDGSGQGRAPRLKPDGNRDPMSEGSYRADLKDAEWLVLSKPPYLELAPWPTPVRNDENKSRTSRPQEFSEKEYNRKNSGSSLAIWAQHLAAWPTPNCMDTIGRRSDEALARAKQKGGCSNLKDVAPMVESNTPARLTVTGDLLTGSCAEMESGGQLNPAHSRWLMGLPAEWDACAPTVTPSSRKSRKV